MSKAVAVPLLVAVLTFTAFVAYDQLRPSGLASQRGDAVDPFPGFDYAFDWVVVPDDNATADVILVAERAQPVQGTWRTPHVAIEPTIAWMWDCAGPVPCGLTHVVAANGTPRLGVDGYNATRVVVHAFDADGALVLSNGNASEQERLTRKLSPDQLPTGLWYLGANQTAPNGTAKPPLAAAFLINQLRPRLHGQPVGGVVTFETDALATYYGRLYVTLQVRELVHAP